MPVSLRSQKGSSEEIKRGEHLKGKATVVHVKCSWEVTWGEDSNASIAFGKAVFTGHQRRFREWSGQKTEPSGWRMEWNGSIANAFHIFCYKKRGNEVAAGGRGQVYFRWYLSMFMCWLDTPVRRKWLMIWERKGVILKAKSLRWQEGIRFWAKVEEPALIGWRVFSSSK